MSAPVFWFGLMLIVVFALKLGWAPAAGSDTWGHLVLPALALGLRPAAFIARVTRSTMLDALREDYILTARAKGLSERAVNLFVDVLYVVLDPLVRLTGEEA